MKIFLLLLASVVIGCNIKGKVTKVIKLNKDEIIKKRLKLTPLLRYDTDNKDYYFSSLAVDNKNEVFAFNKYTGKIIKFDTTGKIVKKTGGIGKGPNEFVTDLNDKILYCGGSKILAYDWSLPRIHLYDTNLNSKRIIQLDGLIYEAACYDKNTYIVLYSTKSTANILNYKGRILNTVKFNNDKVDNLKSFKRLKYLKSNYFISYYFKPLFLRFNKYEGLTHKIILPTDEGERVRTATRNISILNKSAYIFFNDISLNPREKITHVFNTSGSYKYSYKIPNRINYYQILSQDKLITLEDSLRNIVLYKFKIYE